MATIELHDVTLASGLRLEVATSGRGPAILFLHGYTDSWRSFEDILRRLPEDVHALAISQRGHGESDRPASGYHMADLAADAAVLLEGAGIAGAMVVGHSMGGRSPREFSDPLHPLRFNSQGATHAPAQRR